MPTLNRRKFLATGTASLGALGVAHAMPAWARGAAGGTLARRGSDVLSGEHLTMTVADAAFRTGKRHGPAVTVNGTLPGPLVRLKEGQKLVVDLVNDSSEGTSIHWHGMLVPFLMDGVPGVTMAAVKPGETFRYEFPIRQAGTYWWHAHTLQEPMGHYGPIVIDPLEPDPFTWDREYVLMLSDWSPMQPMTIMEKLRTQADYFNYHQTTATDDYPLNGAQRRMWAKMRMSPTDIADVTGSTYTYLINGHGPADGLELPFTPGERIRLRIINGSAMTFFNIRIPGLPMTVVAADGQNVNPVETDEFQIGVAETYDVLITPRDAEAFAFVAESIDRSGMGVAMLSSRPGARASVPPLRKPPVLTMADMGMAMGGDAMAGMDMSGMDMAGMDMGGDKGGKGSGMKMSGMNMRDTSRLPADVKVGPGLGMVAMNPVDRMDFPGLGLDHVDHRVLTYKQLVAASPNPDPRKPTRLKEIHLTGNMERYMWSFDGQKFDAVTDKPIRFAFNERVRVRLVNDTMMVHPIHLHGHFFELVNGAPGDHQPRKHTVNVQPGGSATFDLTADAPGDWAFHCHLFYHMHQGMFQIVTVRPLQEGAEL
ncbi:MULTISPECIES: copper resistance system multicopper oxidase [Novosphingobium]|uniref:Copper resistance system multicopper oxidase n=2 Tax=Novosphingobium TaxID=165696 RepID=A0ABT2I7X8_9SPHN|nr:MULTISPECIES: copper resistance system multicopper oxidase [Novosphingobium]MCT2400898.1 copper resistance system multicopper oxidase [Novosphingobium mangrovi (ex Huang et al. 2023)]CCA93219.1 copper-binding protein [Novosphingobium sp. PP1Y]